MTGSMFPEIHRFDILYVPHRLSLRQALLLCIVVDVVNLKYEFP